MLDQLPSPAFYPPGSSASNALAALTRERVGDALIYTLELTNRPDNRLTPSFIKDGVLPALDDVEREWRADRHGELKDGPGTGAASLITCGPLDAHKFYSNGLNLELAISTPGFFKDVFHFMLARILTFPMPTVAAINGHAFAGGCTLALAHDYRVLKHGEGKAGAMVSLNEVFFGAVIPGGMLGLVRGKTAPTAWTALALGDRLAGQKAIEYGVATDLAQGGDGVMALAKKRAVEHAKKAAAGCFGGNKEALYKDALLDLATYDEKDRATEDDDAAARLGPAPKGRAKL